MPCPTQPDIILSTPLLRFLPFEYPPTIRRLSMMWIPCCCFFPIIIYYIIRDILRESDHFFQNPQIGHILVPLSHFTPKFTSSWYFLIQLGISILCLYFWVADYESEVTIAKFKIMDSIWRPTCKKLCKCMQKIFCVCFRGR